MKRTADEDFLDMLAAVLYPDDREDALLDRTAYKDLVKIRLKTIVKIARHHYLLASLEKMVENRNRAHP